MSVPGSTFPGQTLVTADDLQREHREMARQLLRRTVFLGQSGPEDPDIATDAGNGTITIQGGGRRVFTSGGHLIQLDTSITSVTLPTAEIPSPVFVIALVYEETTGTLGPHAVSGTAQARASAASTRSVVYSAAQYSALPATTTDAGGRTSFGQVAKDRLAIVAYGEYDSTGTLQLTTPSSLSAMIRATRTANSGSAGTLTGVELVRFSSTTLASDPFPEDGTVIDGLLKLTISGSGASAALFYTAPQDGGGYGATSGDLFAGPTADGAELTLSSFDTDYTLTVRVYPSLFPIADGDYIDDLAVSDLYEGLRVGGGRDAAHRGLLGSGLPSADNPHGITLQDAARLIDEVSAVVFGNNLSGDDAAGIPQIRHKANDETASVGSTGFALKREYVGNTSTGAANVREYIDHLGRLVITTNAAWDAPSSVWIPDTDDGSTISSKRTYLGAGTAGATSTDPLRCQLQVRTGITAGTTWADGSWTRTVSDYAVESASGQDALQMPDTQLSLGSNQLGTNAAAARSRILLPMSSAPGRRTWLVDSIDNASSAFSRVGHYRYKGTTQLSTGPTFTDVAERVHGAYWDGAVWQLNGSEALRIIEGPDGFAVGSTSGAGTAADNDFDRVWSWDPTNGLVVAADSEFTGTSTFSGNVNLDATTTVNGTLAVPGTFSVGALTVTSGAPSPAAANTIYTQSTVKGWAVLGITLDSGSPPYTPTVSLVYGFNVELRGSSASGARNTVSYRGGACTCVEIGLVTEPADPDRLCPVVSTGLISWTGVNAGDNSAFYEVVQSGGTIQIFRAASHTPETVAPSFFESSATGGWSDVNGEETSLRLFVQILGGP